MYNGASRWGQAFNHWGLAVFFVEYTWLFKGVTFVFLLSFPLSLPFDWTLRCWVCVCCFVLFYFGYYVVLCVWKKKKKKIVDNKKTKKTIGWPYVPFFPDASWPGFLYCLKDLGFGFVCMCRPIGVWHRFLMFSKRSRGTLNQSNIEILARTHPGKMARMVTLHNNDITIRHLSKETYSNIREAAWDSNICILYISGLWLVSSHYSCHNKKS